MEPFFVHESSYVDAGAEIGKARRFGIFAISLKAQKLEKAAI